MIYKILKVSYFKYNSLFYFGKRRVRKMSLTEHQKEVMGKVLRSKNETSFIYEKIIRQEKLKNKKQRKNKDRESR